MQRRIGADKPVGVCGAVVLRAFIDCCGGGEKNYKKNGQWRLETLCSGGRPRTVAHSNLIEVEEETLVWRLAAKCDRLTLPLRRLTHSRLGWSAGSWLAARASVTRADMWCSCCPSAFSLLKFWFRGARVGIPPFVIFIFSFEVVKSCGRFFSPLFLEAIGPR